MSILCFVYYYYVIVPNFVYYYISYFIENDYTV